MFDDSLCFDGSLVLFSGVRKGAGTRFGGGHQHGRRKDRIVSRRH